MNVLACGGELKSTFCILKENPLTIHTGPTLGDLEDAEKLNQYEREINGFEKKYKFMPDVIVYDLHPEYLSTKYALQRIKKSAGKLRGIPLQHHFAHSVSCLADAVLLDKIGDSTFRVTKHNANENFIGIAFDGLGYGDDGNLWGAEFFTFNLAGYRRAAHLEYVPLPGGAAAVHEPWRMGYVWLQKTFGDDFASLKIPFVKGLHKTELKIIKQMIEKKINSPEISSMGRLFDAVAAILNLRTKVDFEAQAAVELEKIATGRKFTKEKNPGLYKFIIENENKPMIIDAGNVIRTIVNDLIRGETTENISLKFHLSISELILNVCKLLRELTRINKVTLSGGVFQNRLLLDSSSALLHANGFDLLTHKFFSPNDSSICTGQAIAAAFYR